MSSNSLCQLVGNIFEKNRERVFFIDASSEHKFSYQDFEILSNSIGLALRQRGLGHQSRIVFISQNSPEMAAAIFASLIFGFVMVPVSPDIHSIDLENILAVTHPSLVVYGAGFESTPFTSTIDSVAFKDLLHSVSEITAKDFNTSAQLITQRDQNLLTVTFTSGTTSRQKGVVHTVSSLLESAKAFNKTNGFHSKNRFYHTLSMSYMAGILNTILCPFLAEGSVVSDKSFTASLALTYWNNVIKYEVNALWIVPTIALSLVRINRDARAKEYCTKCIERVCIGTAPLSIQLTKDFYNKYGVALSESYGLSELLFICSTSSKYSTEEGAVGLPLDGVKIAVRQGDQLVSKRATEGELYVSTPFVMQGYLAPDSNTFKVNPVEYDLEVGWFNTGDIGHITNENSLTITGRSKDLIIKGGANVSPRAIEEVLSKHQDVAEAAVVGIPHEFYGEDIVAIVRLQEMSNFDEVREKLMESCKKLLSSISVPSKIESWPELPKGATGKVQKSRIREMLRANINSK